MSKLTKLFKNPRLFFYDAMIPKEHRNKKKMCSKDTPLLTAQEYFQQLTNFANSYDVNSLEVGGEKFWPFLRNRIWVQLYALSNKKYKKAQMSYKGMQMGGEDDVPYYLRKRLKQEYDIHDIDNPPSKICGLDFMFFTVINSSEQVQTDNGTVYHRITDPFFDEASKVGSAAKVEVVKINSAALRKSFDYYNKAVHIIPPFIHKTGYHRSVSYGRYFVKTLNQKIPSLKYAQEDIDEFLDWEMHTRDYYIDFFKKTSPKVVFVNGFHYLSPLISAANHLGIKTVDIQHGIQVGWNPLYNCWNEMPHEGYNTLPSHFFVWGDKEKKSIEKVFKSNNHQAVITGFPWLDKQVDLMQPVSEKYQTIFKKYKYINLIILQNQPNVPKIFKDLVAKSSDEHLWIVRHHPKGRRFCKKDFTLKKSNILIDRYFDNISLAQLFSHTHNAISEGSTVAIEGDYFGVYNFIFGNKGKSNYQDEIKSNQFFYISSSSDFFNKVDDINYNIRTSRVNAYHKVDVKEVLKSMLNDKMKGVKNV